MKKNVKKPWIMLCCLTYLSFSCLNTRGENTLGSTAVAAAQVETSRVLPAIAASWFLGHLINFASKYGGTWFRDEVIGIKGVSGKVLALDVKFFMNDVFKHILVENGYQFNNDKLATTTSLESGIKYLSMQELYVLFKRAWLQWEKLHPRINSIALDPDEPVLLKNLLPTNTTSFDESANLIYKSTPPKHTIFTACQDIGHFVYDEINDTIQWVVNVPTMTTVIAQSLASDIPGVTVAALYYFVSYYMTVFTQILSGHFLSPCVKATGLEFLNKKPVSTMIRASIGIVFSEYLMERVTMPFLKFGLTCSGIYDEKREDIHKTMYKAGIKTPFALEFIKKGYATVTNPQFYTAFQSYTPLIKPALIAALAVVLSRITGVTGMVANTNH
jgi:hypothetical protein